MSKQVLSIEQIQHLKELGVDTSKASMCWIIDEENKHKPFVSLSIDASDHVDFTTYSLPTFTLQDILDLLPKRIIDEKGFDYFLAIHIYNNIWNVVYSLYNEILVTINYFNSECLIDAAYEMLCWCVENGYVETKNNNNK